MTDASYLGAMPSLWKRKSTDDQWTVEVPMAPAMLAASLSTFIDVGDPDNISWNEASGRRKDLVGKVNETGFRVRERFSWKKFHPVAWASFVETSTGTRVECHFPGTGTIRALFAYVFCPLLTLFILFGFNQNAGVGGFILIFTGGLGLVVGMIYLQYRSAIGELKNALKQAIRRGVEVRRRP